MRRQSANYPIMHVMLTSPSVLIVQLLNTKSGVNHSTYTINYIYNGLILCVRYDPHSGLCPLSFIKTTYNIRQCPLTSAMFLLFISLKKNSRKSGESGLEKIYNNNGPL